MTFAWRVVVSREHFKAQSTLSTAAALVGLFFRCYMHFPVSVLLIFFQVTRQMWRVATEGFGTFVKALGSDPGVVDVAIVLALVLTWCVNLLVNHRMVVMTSSVLNLVVVHFLILRTLRWAFRPAAPMLAVLRRTLTMSAFLMFLGMVFRALGKAPTHADRTDTLYSSLMGKTMPTTRDRLAELGEAFTREAQARASRIPVKQERLIVFLVAMWVTLDAGIVFSYASVYFGLSKAGILLFGASTSSGGLTSFVAASLAIFTTAPVASVTSAGYTGLVLSAFQVLDAGLMVVLFLSLVLRALPRDSAKEVEEVERFGDEKKKKLKELQDQLEEIFGRLPSSSSEEKEEFVEEPHTGDGRP